jgi:hypothetical protein
MISEKMKFTGNYQVLVIIFLLLLGFLIFLFRNIEINKMWAYGDLAAFPTNMKLMSDWLFYSWREEGLGLANTPVFNYFGFIIIFSNIFGSFLAQKILFISTFIISYFSFYYFLKFFKFSTITSALSAFFYSINPVTISAFVGGSIGESMTIAAFPLIFIYLYKLITEDRFNLKTLAILGLVSLFLWSIYVTFWLCGTAIVALFLMKRNFGRLLRLVPVLCILLLVFLPTIFGLLKMNNSITKEKISFTTEAQYTYGEISFLNLIRLAGNKGSAQGNGFLSYDTINNYTILGLFLSMLPISSTLLTKNFREHNRTLDLFVVSLFLWLILIGVLMLIRNYPSLVDEYLIFFTLRNPSKLMYPLAFFFIIMFSYSIEIFFSKLNTRKYLIAVLAVILLFAITYYNYPALNGNMDLQKLRANNYFVEDKYYQLPKILAKIDPNFSENRILYLPWEYPSNLRIRSELPNYFGTTLGSQLVDIDISKVNYTLSIISQNSTAKGNLLALFDVKYVIIDKSFNSYHEGQSWYDSLKKNYNSLVYYSENSYWLLGNPSYFYSVFKTDHNFIIVYEDDNFAIFQNNILTDKFYKLPINENQDFSLAYSTSSDNLLKNPSFENGTIDWNVWPSNLVNISNDSKDGKFSLAIHGQNLWWTNAYQVVPIKNDTLYQLNFSIKGYNITDLHIKLMWYNQSVNVKEGFETHSDFIVLNLTEGKWYDFDGIFLSPSDTKFMRIQFMGSRLENYTGTITFLDRISFTELVTEVIGIYSNRTLITDFTQLNPTKYVVRLNVSEPVILGFADTYDASWVAYTNDFRTQSLPLYGIMNSFKINKTGNYLITVEYQPQNYYSIILKVTIVTFVIILIYLSYEMVLKKILKKENLFKNIAKITFMKELK